MNQSTSGDTVLDKTENDILTSLQTLLNLTTPNEDYGTMAGDLAVSTEILELLVDYITRTKQDSAHNEMEVEVKNLSPFEFFNKKLSSVLLFLNKNVKHECKNV